MNLVNLRVYAFLVHQNKLLVLKEPYGGKIVNKLPGGGLEDGESPIECLKREFLEEFNLNIKVEKLIFASDEFETYKGYPIVKLYYKISAEKLSLPLQCLEPVVEEIKWIALAKTTEELSLEIDKKAVEYFLEFLDSQ